MRAPLLLIVLLAPLLPLAQAQVLAVSEPQLRLEVAPFDAPVRPQGQAGAAQARVVAFFQAPPVEPVWVELGVGGAPHWADVRLEAERVQLEVQPTASGAWIGEAAFLVLANVNDQAPAFEPGRVVVVANLSATAVTAPAEAEAETSLVPDYFPRLDVAPPPPRVHLASGSSIDVPLVVTNTGNGQSRVWVEVVSSGAVKVAVPSARILPPWSVADVYATTRFPVGLVAPSRLDAPQEIRLRVHHSYALDPLLQGEPVEVALVATPEAVGSGDGAEGGRSAPAHALSSWEAPGDLATLGAAGRGDGTRSAGGSDGSAGGVAFPLGGALVGGAVGLALARRRLRGA